MGHVAAAAALDKNNDSSQPPDRTATAPYMAPQPLSSTPIPGPQPIFSPDSEFHLHQIHYNDLYAPGPVAANINHHHEHVVASDPVKNQSTFSAPVPGPQPGFFTASTDMVYQQPLSAQPGFLLDQHGRRYPPTNTGGPSTDTYALVGPQVLPTNSITIRPEPITVDQNRIQSLQVQTQSYNVPWTTGLFDCFDDPTNAIITLCVPCVTFGQAAEIIDQGSTTCVTHAVFYSCVWFLIGIPCILSYSYRTKLRAKYELMESPANDCLTHFVCEHCALCQMHRELVNRGIDPSIGWQANVQRMQQQQQQQQNYVMAAAPPRQAMM